MKQLNLGGGHSISQIESFEQKAGISSVNQARDILLENIDELEEEEALTLIEIPEETMYLIDKVVRKRSKVGPIGVDNSELINIEVEDEYKQKNQHLLQLIKGQKLGKHSQDESEDKENQDNN